MKLRERIGLAALHAVDPERAHALALSALRMGLSPDAGALHSDRLKVSLAGLDLPHPVGLAAGFDKNATAAEALLKIGAAFVEVGGVTPRPSRAIRNPASFA